MERAREYLRKDYYKVLGVGRQATDGELRKAYRRMSLKLHPDRRRTDDSAALFIELTEAFHYLADPGKRAYYDRLTADIQKGSAKPPLPQATGPTSSRARAKSDAGLFAFAPNAKVPGPTPAHDNARKRRQSDAGSSVPPPFTEPPQVSEPGGPTPEPAATASPPPSPMTPLRRPPYEPDHSDARRAPSAPPHSRNRKDSGETHRQSQRSASAAPASGGRATEQVHESGDENMTDISVRPRPIPRSQSRSRSRPRPHQAPAADSETDVSTRPPPNSPIAPRPPPPGVASFIPSEWIFPLHLTLEELRTGCQPRFRITRSLLSGETVELIVTVPVQPGWQKGTRVTFPGAGHQLASGDFQDLVFVVQPMRHHRFEREGVGGTDLGVYVGLSLVDALASREGRTARFEGLGGGIVEVPLPDGVVKPGMVTVVPSEGMPIRKGGKVVGMGNLIVRWVIVFPDALTTEQQADLKAILAEQSR